MTLDTYPESMDGVVRAGALARKGPLLKGGRQLIIIGGLSSLQRLYGFAGEINAENWIMSLVTLPRGNWASEWHLRY